ncbi:hypothetical protein HA402_005295 [Bradysia odoriphaga]|nr:hypothetical protein HA402_005295 [Bradysia odoriphaga]
MEPSTKRIKLDSGHSTDTTSFQIKSILSDELLKAIDTVDVYTMSIIDSKSTSEIMLKVNKLLPVPNLQHLKRIKKKDMILCPVKDVANFLKESETFFERVKHILPDTVPTKSVDETVKSLLDLSSESSTNKSILSEYLRAKGFKDDMTEKLTTNITVSPVPSIQPKLRWQYSIATEQWPCKFHLNKQLENLYSHNVFNENEKNFHIQFMELSMFISSNTNDKSVGVIVDPRNKHIVAVGETRIDLHPLMHCSMVLIDMVARSQNGGAWRELDISTDQTDNDSFNHNGIDSEIRTLIGTKFSVKFGAQKPSSVVLPTLLQTNDSTSADNLSKYGPYLCTGYDVYLTDEPCIMCAMALVHSRARRIFFHRPNAKGALKTLTKLHTIKALNHHYEVYQIS